MTSGMHQLATTSNLLSDIFYDVKDPSTSFDLNQVHFHKKK